MTFTEHVLSVCCGNVASCCRIFSLFPVFPAECLYLPHSRQQPTGPGCENRSIWPIRSIWEVGSPRCHHIDVRQMATRIMADPVLNCLLHRQVNVSLPEETRANGTLYAVVYVHKAGVSPLEDNRAVHYAAQLTTYIPPLHAKAQKVTFSPFKLPLQTCGSGANQLFVWLHQRPERPVSHWRPHLSVSVMSEDFPFTKAGLPSDVRRYMRV